VNTAILGQRSAAGHPPIPGRAACAGRFRALAYNSRPFRTMPHLPRHPRRRHSLALWFALLAMWFGVLAPTVSHALAAAGSSAWVEVCTTQGMRWVAVADEANAGPADASGGPAAHLDHCPACNAGGGGMAPPPAPLPWAPLPSLREGLPPRFEQAPRTAHAWQPAQARAPPALG
jgi:hypothetical protein